MAAAVVAGLLIGFAASTLAYRYRILMVPGGNLIERMDRDLNLTPAQHQQIREIMRDKRSKVEQLRREFRQQRRQLFLQAHDQIRAVLTPEQQEKFDRDFIPPGVRQHKEQHQQAAP